MDEPHNLTDDVLMATFTAIGHITVNWALLEFSLDAAIIAVYHEAGGRTIEAQLSKALSRRITFLRRCLNGLAILAPFAADGRQLIADIKRLANTRHGVTHGYLSGLDAATNRLTFIRLDMNKERTQHYAVEMEISIPGLVNAGIEIQDVARRLRNFSISLFAAFGVEHESADALRKIAD